MSDFLKEMRQLPIVLADDALGGKLEALISSDNPQEVARAAKAYVNNTPGHSSHKKRRALQEIERHLELQSDSHTVLSVVHRAADYAQVSPLSKKKKNIFADIASTVQTMESLTSDKGAQEKVRILVQKKVGGDREDT